MADGSSITTEYCITKGKVSQSQKAQPKRVDYLVDAYITSVVDELKKEKLKTLLELKFGSVSEGIEALGGIPAARQTFRDFQYRLYA